MNKKAPQYSVRFFKSERSSLTNDAQLTLEQKVAGAIICADKNQLKNLLTKNYDSIDINADKYHNALVQTLSDKNLSVAAEKHLVQLALQLAVKAPNTEHRYETLEILGRYFSEIPNFSPATEKKDLSTVIQELLKTYTDWHNDCNQQHTDEMQIEYIADETPEQISKNAFNYLSAFILGLQENEATKELADQFHHALKAVTPSNEAVDIDSKEDNRFTP